MEKEDTRNQTLEQFRERRKEVVRLHKMAIKIMKFVELTGLTYRTVRATVARFGKGGSAAVRSVPSVGKYLARWGFMPQRPMKPGYKQNPEAMQVWLQGEFPGMEQGAKREGADIHWGDETGLTTADVRNRSYALAGKKVFLILDTLRVHYSNIIKVWVAEHKEQIELFYLPSYSPQINPEERLIAALKPEMSKRVPVRTKAKYCQAATEHMTMRVQTPERIIGYFQDRDVKYAA